MAWIKIVAFILKSVKWHWGFIGMNKSGVLRNSPKSCGRSKLRKKEGVSRVNRESWHVCSTARLHGTGLYGHDMKIVSRGVWLLNVR